MKDSDRQTRSHLMQLFREHGLHPRHDLGQNFLIDLNLLEFIARSARVDIEDVVLEVGTGTASLTRELAGRAGHVVSVEYDPNMHAFATAALAECKNVTLLNCDVLKTKNRLAPSVLDAVSELLAQEEGRRLKLVANLPYHVATPVISNLIATDLPLSLMVVTVQWELGERMASRPGRSQYGALAVWLQAQCRVKLLKKLSPKVFWPRPEVESAIVRIEPDATSRALIADRDFFHDYLRRVFQQRRKLLRGVLRKMYRDLAIEDLDGLLEDHGAATRRAEELAPAEHVQLANDLVARTAAAT